MSDYVPPDNPYDAPREEGQRPEKRSNTWLFVLIAVVGVMVLGCFACGASMLLVSRSAVAPAPQIVIESAPIEASGDANRAEDDSENSQ